MENLETQLYEALIAVWREVTTDSLDTSIPMPVSLETCNKMQNAIDAYELKRKGDSLTADIKITSKEVISSLANEPNLAEWRPLEEVQ